MPQSQELKQHRRQCKLGLSKILWNIKYVKQQNAFLKEIQNHRKMVVPKLFHSWRMGSIALQKNLQEKFGATRGCFTNIQRNCLQELPRERSDFEDCYGQSQSSHGCFPNHVSINRAPWKSTVSSALDFQVRTPLLTGRITWDQCCLGLEFYVSYNPFAVVGPVLFLHLLMNIEIYIWLI